MLPYVPHRFFEGGGLPDAYEAQGFPVSLQTDFRTWLKYDYLRGNHDDLTNAELITAMVCLCCSPNSKDSAPIACMVEAITWFHSCGDSERTARIKIGEVALRTMNEQPKSVCLFWDFKAIWDSFKKQYDIDLYSCGEMHWWEFMRLLRGLKADTPYAALRHMRGVSKTEFVGGDANVMRRHRERQWSLLECERTFAALPHKW